VRPEERLYAALVAGSPTSAIVSIVGANIWPTQEPNTYGLPAVVYQRTSTEYIRTVHPDVNPVTTTAIFDVFCLATTYAAAESLGDLVEAVERVDPQVQAIDRSSTLGDGEDAPYAAIVTMQVDS
jgi:hypothetical protein